MLFRSQKYPKLFLIRTHCFLYDYYKETEAYYLEIKQPYDISNLLDVNAETVKAEKERFKLMYEYIWEASMLSLDFCSTIDDFINENYDEASTEISKIYDKVSFITSDYQSKFSYILKDTFGLDSKGLDAIRSIAKSNPSHAQLFKDYLVTENIIMWLENIKKSIGERIYE